MNLIYIFSDYFLWHFTEGYGYIFSFWKNIIWATFRIFSTKTIIFTLFTPWRRLDFEYPDRFNAEEYISDFIINTLMRFVGFIIRSIFLILNLIIILTILILLGFSLLVWTLIPILIISLIVYAIKII